MVLGQLDAARSRRENLLLDHILAVGPLLCRTVRGIRHEVARNDDRLIGLDERLYSRAVVVIAVRVGDEDHVREFGKPIPVRLAPDDSVGVLDEIFTAGGIEFGAGCDVDCDGVLRPFDDVAHVVDAPEAQTALGNCRGGDF